MPSPYTKTQTTRYHIDRYSINLAPQSQQPAHFRRIIICQKSKTGRLLPNWRQIIRQGGNATTEFSGWQQWVEVDYPYMNASYRRQVSPNVWELYRTYDSSFENFINWGIISSDFTSTVVIEALNQAIARLYQNLHKARHQLQGGVILGEIHKTARLLTGVTKRLKQTVVQTVTGMNSVRSKVKASPAKVRRQALSNAYLEYTFGWQPLLHDVRDLAVTLARIIEFRDRTRIRAQAESEKVISLGTSEIQFSYLKCNMVSLEKCRAEVIFRGFLQGKPLASGIAPLERIISLSGFDLASFIPTMWELVPYSFIVDYFTNIGDVLYAISADTSLISGLWRTIRIESTREYWITPKIEESTKLVLNDPDNRDAIVTGQAGYYAIKYRTVGRESSSVPYLMPRLKGLDLPWRQYANIGALFTRR